MVANGVMVDDYSTLVSTNLWLSDTKVFNFVQRELSSSSLVRIQIMCSTWSDSKSQCNSLWFGKADIVSRYVGSTIIDIVYGMDGEKNDYMVSVAEELMSIITVVLSPGKFLVDLLPLRASCTFSPVNLYLHYS